MKHAALAFSTLLFAALSVPVFAQQQKPPAQDAKSIQELAEANMAEVEAGKVAAQKAKSEDVKKFAQHMVDDHGKMLQEVRQLAESKGVKLPSAPNAKHQAVMKKLESASADRFDRAYMQAMVNDHRETLKKVENVARNGKDPEVKAAAEKALPNIKEHLQMAQQIAAKTGGSAGKASSGSSSGESKR
jgi:putative membrane protein